MMDPRIQILIDAPHSANRVARIGLPCTAKPGKRKPTQPRGHIAPPGSGPSGETCGTCCAYTRVSANTAGTFRKCGNNQHNWTRGPGSDIRKRDAACSHWERAS